MRPPKPIEICSPSTVAWFQNHGVIYFISAGDPPTAIKIGVAAVTAKMNLRTTILRRLSQIQSSNHELIRLLGVLCFTEGSYPARDAAALERELHIEFGHLRRFKEYARGAEWFEPTPELLARIEQIATKPEVLELPEFFSVRSDSDAKPPYP